MTTIWTVAVLIGLTPAMQIDHRGSSETETRRVPAVVKETVREYVVRQPAPKVVLAGDDADRNVRMKQLLNEADDLKQIRAEKARFWLTNQPSCLSYDRLKGAIGP